MQPRLVDTLTVTTWLTVEPVVALLAARDRIGGPSHELDAADPEVSRANDPQRNLLVAISPAEVRRG